MAISDPSLDRFTKIVAVLSIFIGAAGFTNLYFYYKIFNIQIFDFISISEIITSSISFFLFLLFPITMAFFILRPFVLKFSSQDEEKTVKLVRRFWAVLPILFFLFAMLSLFLSFFGNTFIKKFLDQSFLSTYLCFMILVTIFFYFAFQKYFVKTLDVFSIKRLPVKYVGVMVFFLLFYLNAERKAYFIIENKDHFIATLQLSNNTTITTNDSIKYIGKTEGYYFMYNINSKTSTIYPASEIKKIDIKP